MKRIYSLIVAGGLLAAGCDSYFNEDLYQNIPQENAYATVSDVENALNGVYYAFGSYRFMGRNAVAIGDMSADMAGADGEYGRCEIRAFRDSQHLHVFRNRSGFGGCMAIRLQGDRSGYP